MRILTVMVVLLVSIALGLMFIVLNSTRVDINFFFFTLQNYPLAFGMFIALALGVFLGIVACLGMMIPLRFELKRMRRQKELVEQELNKLRALPSDNE